MKLKQRPHKKTGTNSTKRGGEQGGESPSSILSEPISPSSLNGYVSFSPSSQLFLGHFSLLPILFLPPPRKPAILNFCRQTRGKVCKHNLLVENYSLNTKKLFTRPDLEFLTVKLQLLITDPSAEHENEAKLYLSFRS